MSVLEVKDLSIQLYIEETPQMVVDHMSYAVDAGEIFGVVGASGAGKSMHAKALMDVLPKRAQIVGGNVICSGTKTMIFQNPHTALNPVLTIGKQLMETIEIHSPKIAVKERAIELLDQVGIRKPEEKLKVYPHQLSGGLCQRVAIAIALACHPKVLVADEPTTALDVTVQAQILSLLKKIARDQKVAIVLISHDLGVIANTCKRMLVMKKGQVVEMGTVEDLFYHPRELDTQELMKSLQENKNPLLHFQEIKPILEVQEVYKRYQDGDKTRAIQGLSLDIKEGENLGLVGESGCGKTTLAKLIVGIEKPTGGSISYAGDSLEVQMIFQDSYTSLNPAMKVYDILKEPLLAKRKRGFKKASLRGLALNKMEAEEKIEEKIQGTLEAVGLEAELLGRYPGELSGGQRQRIGIARALVLDPKLLLCDEAVAAQDPKLRSQIVELLVKLQRESHIACLFISHDLNVVRSMSQRIGVMYQGRLVEMGGTADVTEDPWHPYTKALLSAEPLTDPKKARKQKPLILRGEEEEAETGCPFAGACKYALEICKMKTPAIYEFNHRQVSCFLYSKEPEWNRDSNYKMTSQI